MKAFICGSGAWGTALSVLLCDNGNEVTIWTRSGEKASAVNFGHINPSLSDIILPAELKATTDISLAATADAVVFVSPSYALESTVKLAAPFIKADALVISATKGIDRETNRRMSEIISQYIPNKVVVLSGPSHAEEVSKRMETGCVAACSDLASAEAAQRLFMSDVFRVYTNEDIVGVEICGAAKNVIALGAGILSGMGAGDNLSAMYMTRAMAEISTLCIAMGGSRETCLGLAGMGDLIVTCCSVHSRNRRAGEYIGKGETVEQALKHVGAVVEGYYAAASMEKTAKKMDCELPIINAIYKVLYKNQNPKKALNALMKRIGKTEF